MQGQFLNGSQNDPSEDAPKYSKIRLLEVSLIFSALTVFAVIDALQEAEDKHKEQKKKTKENQKLKKDE